MTVQFFFIPNLQKNKWPISNLTLSFCEFPETNITSFGSCKFQRHTIHRSECYIVAKLVRQFNVVSSYFSLNVFLTQFLPWASFCTL